MSEQEAEGAPAQNPAAHFSGNIMNFEQPKFNARQENRLGALKVFKKKCGYIFKGSLVNISEEKSIYWYKIGSDRKARRFMTV